MKNDIVSIVGLDSYEEEKTFNALKEVILNIDDLTWVKQGMTIGIKVNLVAAMKPEEAGTTNPTIVKCLCKLLIEKGANVIVGDSPGGIFTSSFVNNIYKTTQMTMVEEVGAKLNQDFNQCEVKFEEGLICKRLDSCTYLQNVDALINVCKLKTHGMMAMSCAVKNMFGTVGGTLKPEYHFRYPRIQDFANMLIDINEYYKCKLNIVDAVIGMEGNGPTAGKPRFIGALLCSKSPYNLDLVCAKLIGLNIDNVPTLKLAYERNLQQEKVEDVNIIGEYKPYMVLDYDLIKKLNGIEFDSHGKLFSIFAKKCLQNRPKVKKKECIGCKKCYNICPAKAIEMKNGIPVIDRKKCIKCYCCQEFCPKGAMKVHRTIIAKILNNKK